MKFLRPDTHMIVGYRPVDMSDHENERSAVELALPSEFSDKAKACWEYFKGTAFIFEYKERLVVTDESHCLTEHGNGETLPTVLHAGFVIPGMSWSKFLKKPAMTLTRMDFWKGKIPKRRGGLPLRNVFPNVYNQQSWQLISPDILYF